MIFHHDTKTKKQKTIYTNHETKIIVFDDVIVQTKTIAKFVKKHNDVIRYEKNSADYLYAKKLTHRKKK